MLANIHSIRAFISSDIACFSIFEAPSWQEQHTGTSYMNLLQKLILPNDYQSVKILNAAIISLVLASKSKQSWILKWLELDGMKGREAIGTSWFDYNSDTCCVFIKLKQWLMHADAPVYWSKSTSKRNCLGFAWCSLKPVFVRCLQPKWLEMGFRVQRLLLSLLVWRNHYKKYSLLNHEACVM